MTTKSGWRWNSSWADQEHLARDMFNTIQSVQSTTTTTTNSAETSFFIIFWGRGELFFFFSFLCPPQHSPAKKVSVLDLVLNWTSASVIDGHQKVLRTRRAPWYYYCNIVKDYTIICDRRPNISTRTTNSAHINSDFFSLFCFFLVFPS